MRPRPWIIVGSALVGLGAFILFRGIVLHSQGVVKFGPFHGGVEAQHVVPPWLGIVAILLGGLLIFAGIRAKK
jgi:hypothetical protein